MAVQESDLLVVVGARFDDRATGKLVEFAPLAEVIHLDLDAAEIGKLRHAHAGVVGDVAASLRALAGVMPGDPTAQDAWRTLCVGRKHRHAARYDAPGPDVYAPALPKRPSELAPDALRCCAVRPHPMWLAQHLRFQERERGG